jgi:hypothetical protein
VGQNKKESAVTQFSVRRELQPLAEDSNRRASKAATVWDRVVAAIKDPELVVVCGFCAIGLLLTLNVMLRFAEFGATISQFAHFP